MTPADEREIETNKRALQRLRTLRDQLKENIDHLAVFEDDYSIEDLDFGPPLTIGDIRFIYGMLWRAEEVLDPKQPAQAA